MLPYAWKWRWLSTYLGSQGTWLWPQLKTCCLCSKSAQSRFLWLWGEMHSGTNYGQRVENEKDLQEPVTTSRLSRGCRAYSLGKRERSPFCSGRARAAFPDSWPSRLNHWPLDCWVKQHFCTCRQSRLCAHLPGSPLPWSLLQQFHSFRWNRHLEKKVLCSAWKWRCDPVPRRMDEVKAAIPTVCRNWSLPQVPVCHRHRKSDVSLLKEKGLLCCQLESLCTQRAFPLLSTFE